MSINPSLQASIKPFDKRRALAVLANRAAAIDFAVNHLLDVANNAIQAHNAFYLALSGGSTPKAIYKELSLPSNRKRIPWEKVFLFWSDERSAPPTDPDSNYHMAMEAGFKMLPIPKEQIFRMEAEKDIAYHAKEYEETIKRVVPGATFDLVMLGMGDDGHTASLFPHTVALIEEQHLVVANNVPQQETQRMTFTYPLINAAHNIVLYVIGANKTAMAEHVLTTPYTPLDLPSQRVGTEARPALWILDNDAAAQLSSTL
ncbi:6-phosphogluconolactonase [Simkania negevensis]|uniref:6-phosphogluconolactonase n=1 Tax=Simkania negevensis TaxID=83561 RepID=A0ABS3AQM9_9BACT|nr:6-phosphogluconolactonase [Simkania negevensis]